MERIKSIYKIEHLIQNEIIELTGTKIVGRKRYMSDLTQDTTDDIEN